MELSEFLARPKLNIEFYKRDVVTVAQNLLNQYFVHKESGSYLIGKIVEVEAYSKIDDEASHSFKGRTKRNASMFLGGGHLYVYLSYGINYCANIVTGEIEAGDAVLIRAVEPVYGVSKMAINRTSNNVVFKEMNRDLTNGPGKFSKAFNINLTHDAENLLGENIFILENYSLREEIISTERIGISKSKNLIRRFYINNSKFVSKR
ncbi:MAG: DNA-3-methyladenine glycosylase [Ignavibacteriaceae bacterium]|nr:DNA-3-methyladenine glycosylase [Ignavibacteriaceae bacterium]HRI48480.1 DNA-3-methyladenine glycosylase [Ignavibacteriaceae bacterium]